MLLLNIVLATKIKVRIYCIITPLFIVFNHHWGSFNRLETASSTLTNLGWSCHWELRTQRVCEDPSERIAVPLLEKDLPDVETVIEKLQNSVVVACFGMNRHLETYKCYNSSVITVCFYKSLICKANSKISSTVLLLCFSFITCGLVSSMTMITLPDPPLARTLQALALPNLTESGWKGKSRTVPMKCMKRDDHESWWRNIDKLKGHPFSCNVTDMITEYIIYMYYNQDYIINLFISSHNHADTRRENRKSGICTPFEKPTTFHLG